MSNVSKSTSRLTTLAILIALEMVLGFTPLGFIAIPPVSITTMHIPVIIAAIILGPADGAILGLTFGLISIFSAITRPISPIAMLLSPFSSGAPLYSIIMCIGPRVLLGIIPAYINKLLSKHFKLVLSTRALIAAISAAIATICHTITFLGCMYLFFHALVLKEIFFTIISLNGTVELLAAIIIVPAIAMPLRKFMLSTGKGSAVVS